MANEKFCLRWNDFESNISVAFRELRDDKDFFDVTLACEDEQLQAHKVILSACSPFFRTLLRRNHHAHPLLYLRGVKYSDLQAVLNFMYHGEVNVAQEELNSFLSVAEELRVKGLTQNQSSHQAAPPPHVSSHPKPASRLPHSAPTSPPPPPAKRPRPPPSPEVQEMIMPPVKCEPVHEETSLAPLYPEEEQYEEFPEEEHEEQYSMESYSQDQLQHGEPNKGNDRSVLVQYITKEEVALGSGKAAMFRCTLCGKTNAQKNNLINHVEGIHFPNLFVYSCQFCDKTVKTKNALYLHVNNFHKQEQI